MERLRREVLVPLPTHRRPTSLIGLGVALVLLASAVDAMVWSFQAQRELIERQRTTERPAPPRVVHARTIQPGTGE